MYTYFYIMLPMHVDTFFRVNELIIISSNMFIDNIVLAVSVFFCDTVFDISQNTLVRCLFPNKKYVLVFKY